MALRKKEKRRKQEGKKEKEKEVSLTVADEAFLIVQKFGAVLTGCGRGRIDWEEEMAVCTLLFSLFTLPFPLSSPLLLLEATHERYR